MGSFLFVYIWPFVGSIVFLSGGLNSQGSYFANSIIGFIFYPLGGLFNTIVYTRQKWQIVRKRRECSRISAFFAVLRHGGELPKDCQNKKKNRGTIIGGGKEKLSFVDRINRRLQKMGFKNRQKSESPKNGEEQLKPKDEQQAPAQIFSKKAHNKISRLDVSPEDLEDIDVDDAIPKVSMPAFSSGLSIKNEDGEGFGRLESGLSIAESGFVEVEDNPESWIDDDDNLVNGEC